MGTFEIKEIENWEHDETLAVKKVMPYGWDGTVAHALNSDTDGNLKVTDAGSTDQTIIDEAVTGTTYIGRGTKGLSTSVTGWVITKIVESGISTTIQHAISSWDLRSDGGTVYS